MQKLWRSMKLHRAHIAELCLSLQENETMGKVSPSFHSLSSFKQRPQHCWLHRCFGSSASSVCSVWFYACRFPSVLNRQTSSPAHCIKHRCNDTPREQPLHHSKFQPPNVANSSLSLSQVSVWLRPEQLKPASSHSADGCSTALTCCVLPPALLKMLKSYLTLTAKPRCQPSQSNQMEAGFSRLAWSSGYLSLSAHQEKQSELPLWPKTSLPSLLLSPAIH